MIQELEPIRGCDMAGNIIYEGPPSEFSIMEKINEIVRYLNEKEHENHD